ncbi:MAG: response regulator [Oscillospiraceae bacterium]|nr:response regulator [Oscillospiraceae bacterium]
MKILIIEDNPLTVKGIVDFASDNNHSCDVYNFQDFTKKIVDYSPDILILDWKNDVDDYDAGNPIFEYILTHQFMPLIIFSAIAQTIEIPSEIKDLPLVNILEKGDEQPVIDCITNWEPYISSINELRSDMNKALIESTKAIGSFMSVSTPQNDVIKYMLNKRANQYFDNDAVGENPPAWIEYLYPPMKSHLLVSDVLRVISKESDHSLPGQPEEYYVVLTPSCDMANTTGPVMILLAHCTSKGKFSDVSLGSSSIDSGKGKDKVDKVKAQLNYGYNKANVALPGLPNIIPYLTINLKDIIQVLNTEIALSYEQANETHKYYRVASINSPFREQIVWAHMINSCRPGMPNRDVETWAKGILV